MFKNAVGLGFIGFCKTDIMLYMARILHLMGENVAIIDQSGQQELRYSVPAVFARDDRLDYRGVDVFFDGENINPADLPAQNYSVFLVDYGVHSKNIGVGLKTLFIVTDMQRHHAVPLSSCLGSLHHCPDAIRIIRDIVPGKIRPRYIDSLLQAGQFTNLIAKYDLPFGEAEFVQRLNCQHDDIFQFHKISDGYKNMLIECITELFGTDRKTLAKAFKKAQRGG